MTLSGYYDYTLKLTKSINTIAKMTNANEARRQLS